MLHNVGNIGIFVLLKFEHKLDTVVSHININSKQHDKYKLAYKSLRNCTKVPTLPTYVYYGKT